MSPWGAQTAAHQPVGHNGSLKAWNNLTKCMGFASADYHRSATQQTNQQTNQPPTNLTSSSSIVFSSENATTELTPTSLFDFSTVAMIKTPAGAHTSMHTSAFVFFFFFRPDLFLEALCVITRVFWGFGCTRDAVNTLLFSRPRRASQFPFISCLAPTSSCNSHIVVV